jgi:competence protein ComGC
LSDEVEAPVRAPRPARRGVATSHGTRGSTHRCGVRAIAASAVRRGLRNDAGFTLVEMLVGCIVAVTVLSATFALLESSQQVQARDSEWALTLQEDRAGVARIMRDVRQATKVEEATTGAVKFLATIGGKEWEIKYECGVTQSGTTYTQCVRLVAEKGKALPGTGPPVVKDVTNGAEVFTYSPSTAEPKMVTAKVKLPAAGTLKLSSGNRGLTHEAVLEDAAFMRNLYPEG